MGQIEVYEWLKIQRLSGNNAYFSCKEIERGIKNSQLFNGNSQGVWGAVVQLESYGYLEASYKGNLRDFRRVVRLKKRYVVKK